MDDKKLYESHLGSTFVIEFADANLDLELIEVSEVTAEKTETGQATPFSALFRSNSQDAIEQGTYLFKHDKMAEATLFIVPIGPDDVGMRYEAIFT